MENNRQEISKNKNKRLIIQEYQRYTAYIQKHVRLDDIFYEQYGEACLQLLNIVQNNGADSSYERDSILRQRTLIIL